MEKFLNKKFDVDNDHIPHVTDPSMENPEVVDCLKKNGYNLENGIYTKKNKDIQIKAIIDKGVVLHLADKKGKILTSTKYPIIYPTIKIDNLQDIPEAERQLCCQFKSEDDNM